MKVCRKCGAKYFGGEVFCSLDGEPLVGKRTSGLMDTVRASQASESGEDPFVGNRIEKYDIISTLGEGGMGVVYEARHVHIGKRVALKVLREDFSRKEDVVERFRQEARSASIIGHDNIIDITDFGTTQDGRFFFVMEYLDGEDLATVFETHRTIPYERALGIIKQVCMGLMAAHEKGIIHRDLKPENIFLIQAGQNKEIIKILDFGIAKMNVLDEEGRKLTKTGVVFGTPEYMSPEQSAGKEVDERIDIYAIGVIMYEMFTGTVPFTGDTFMSILTKHMFEPVPEMRFMNTNLSIPPAMEQIVMRTLEKEADLRIGSMAELLDAVRKVEADPTTVEFAPSSLPPRDPSGTTPGPVLEVVGDVGEEHLGRRRGGLLIAIPVILLLVAAGALAAFILPGMLGAPGGGADPGVSAAAGGDETGTGEIAPPGEQTGEEPPGDEEIVAVEAETVIVRVETDLEDTTVSVEGRGTVCEATPCEFSALRDEELSLVLVRGKVRKAEALVASADPTVFTCSMKPPRKPGKGKPGPGEAAEGGGKPVKEEGGKGHVDVGDLKIPSVYKKD